MAARRHATPLGALDAAADKLARAIDQHATLCGGIAGTLPLAEAEALMDDIEDQLDVIRVKLTRARAVVLAEAERLENVA